MADGAVKVRRGPKPNKRIGLDRLRDDDDALLTYDQVAQWLQCSERKVKNLVAEGLPMRRFGWQPRVRVGDLRAWIRQTPIVGM